MIVFYRKLIIALLSLAAVAGLSNAAVAAPNNPHVLLKTDLGSIVIELYPQQAPITVANFLKYVDNKFYDGTIFHRVIPGFVVQGGGLTYDFAQKATLDPIKNESGNGLKNEYKTLSMARTADPDSATSQFFINLQANPSLDATDKKPGYAVFAKVTDGMDVVEKIVAEPRGIFHLYPDAPNAAVRILSATRYGKSQVGIEEDDSMKSSTIRDALVTKP